MADISKITVNSTTYNIKDTTARSTAEGKVSCTTANVKSALGTGSGTTKYLREDGSWATPAGTVPTYTYNSTTKVLTISY